MNTWKLSIKPDSQEGFDAFKKCKEKSLLGLGWHHAYLSQQPSDLLEAKKLVKGKWDKWPYQLKYLLEDMKAADHVWIHQNGEYFLCEVRDESILYGSAIDPDFSSYDLGHARNATWVNVPEEFVTGAIQRGTIARRMIQKIGITEREVNFNRLLFAKLSENPTWEPRINTEILAESLASIPPLQLFSLMSPDDVEDIVSAYLQDKGWVLIKSTCFRSKPFFEFSMLNKNGDHGYVQVKSGKNPDQLRPEKYEKHAGDKNSVFLFSTNQNPYPGNDVSGVHAIAHTALCDWIISNPWAITLPLKTRLWIFLQEREF